MHHIGSSAHVHPVIELRARQMRSALTPSEQTLWEAIRGCRLGVWFRRQVPIGRYIADFVAPSMRLVVEVDGQYHARRGVADARRDRVLTRHLEHSSIAAAVSAPTAPVYTTIAGARLKRAERALAIQMPGGGSAWSKGS